MPSAHSSVFLSSLCPSVSWGSSALGLSHVVWGFVSNCRQHSTCQSCCWSHAELLESLWSNHAAHLRGFTSEEPATMYWQRARAPCVHLGVSCGVRLLSGHRRWGQSNCSIWGKSLSNREDPHTDLHWPNRQLWGDDKVYSECASQVPALHGDPWWWQQQVSVGGVVTAVGTGRGGQLGGECRAGQQKPVGKHTNPRSRCCFKGKERAPWQQCVSEKITSQWGP